MQRIFSTYFPGFFFLLFSGSLTMAQPGFRKMENSGISFNNAITESEKVNIMMYDYLYNGGGVGIGDFNKDGLPDIFLSGNMVPDQLYINQGKLVFKEITTSAGIEHNGWSTGVLIMDFNQDGWDDIYICRSGWFEDDNSRRNVLYINNQDLTFTEKAADYGLDLPGHHTMAAPLDFDLDGDLDLYIIGHPGSFQHVADFQQVIANIRAGKVESDLLLENIDGKYVDITRKAGIMEYGYSLGLAVTDVNQDGYPDIIVCNDFDEPDHLFVNQKNGTFKDQNLQWFRHTSNYSMGNDVGDFNNDGLLDYIAVDMAYETHERSKQNMASMNPEKFAARLMMGWGRQYMHNMLQLNDGMGSFQEISQYAGVAKTDWSWAPLFMDIDMDGWKDLFVTNGYKRDTKNNDLKFKIDSVKNIRGEITVNEFLDLIPSVDVANFFFRNEHNLKFSDQRKNWGVDEKLKSNGAAYADLDQDGDLDLILNNVDAIASVYENTGNAGKNYLHISFASMADQDYLGSRFTLRFVSGAIQVQEAYFARGFQSTVEKGLYFYWENDQPFLLEIRLPNGKTIATRLDKGGDLSFNEELIATCRSNEMIPPVTRKFFKEVTADYMLGHHYRENDFNDFEKESLLPHRMSTNGPEIVVGDLNKDGLEDFVISSPVGQIPTVYLQTVMGSFKKTIVPAFYNHQSSEDGGMHIFDVNHDGNLDLFVSSGGYEHAPGDTAYMDRLYIGNGLGMFGLVKNGVESEFVNSGRVIGEDMDGDGDTDFLICGGAFPGKYPYAGKTTILENFTGFLKERTYKTAPQLERLGIVNDAVFSDFDGDGDRDLVVVGEWMDVTFFVNQDGKYIQVKEPIGIPGWWTCIEAVDIDGDGDEDYLLGNAGMNNKFNASILKPLDIYANDFDDNGTLDIVLAKKGSHSMIPVRGRECSSGQMPFITEKFPTYRQFAVSGLDEIYSPEKLEKALHYQVNEFRNGVLVNKGKGDFDFLPFEGEAQFSFINDFLVYDVDGSGLPDIIAVGNRYGAEVETTSYDAANGLVILQKDTLKFQNLPSAQSGFYVPHDARSMKIIHLGKEKKEAILVGSNNGPVQLFVLN